MWNMMLPSCSVETDEDLALVARARSLRTAWASLRLAIQKAEDDMHPDLAPMVANLNDRDAALRLAIITCMPIGDDYDGDCDDDFDPPLMPPGLVRHSSSSASDDNTIGHVGHSKSGEGSIARLLASGEGAQTAAARESSGIDFSRRVGALRSDAGTCAPPLSVLRSGTVASWARDVTNDAPFVPPSRASTTDGAPFPFGAKLATTDAAGAASGFSFGHGGRFGAVGDSRAAPLPRTTVDSPIVESDNSSIDSDSDDGSGVAAGVAPVLQRQ